MKILFIGKTDFKYNRVQVLIEGLKQLDGVDVLFYPLKSRSSIDKKDFLRIQEDIDFIYIPPFRHRDVRFIKSISTKPVVFDPLISKLLTKAVDYRQFWKIPSKYYLDKVAFSNCDILIADTEEDKNYYCKTFRIKESKVGVVPVGVNTSQFFPLPTKSKTKTIVGSYASYVPLQGMPKIIRAAEILKNNKNIEFHLIGSGYDFKKVKRFAEKHNLTNVKFSGKIKYEALNEAVNKFDICMGIFGDSLKADSVIPNKVYHYAALRKCIISKDTPAIKEIFTNNENIILCENKPQQIADNILKLINNTELRNKIAKNGYKVISEDYNHTQVARSFVKILEDYQKNR
ncbi:glycosyltransferase [Carboxylicivirga marina]|uniref:Glycosyltransferase n=1 Tax=Carboxylicivirga marina TaxID=2800988 RepID=A0ABS1HQI7_9BACT|nr:glycosyltransferase [Carboxylicivirga marina]MBK3519493.1 glycosyltransferase [Carboxylicivirga marina]